MSACSILPTSSDKALRTYVLSPEFSEVHAGPASQMLKNDVLLVSLPRAQAGLDTQRMAYLSEPYLLSYYAHSQWADVPARLLAPPVGPRPRTTALLSHGRTNAGCDSG